MLEALVQHGPMRKLDLIERLNGKNGPFSVHLHKLQKLGLVDYLHAHPEEQGWSQYAWSKGKPDDVQKVRTYTHLTQEVAEAVYKSGKATNVHEIIEKIGRTPSHGNKCMVSHILAGIEAQGHITSGLNRERKSSVSILPPGEKLFEVARILSSSVAGGRGAKRIVRDSWEKLEDPGVRMGYASRGIALYEKAASRLHAIASSRRQELLLRLFGKKTRLRPVDAAKLLSWDYANADRGLRALNEKKLLRKEQEGSGTYYHR